MSEVFQNKKALYHYSPTLFLSVTTRSSAVVSDVTYLDSRSCQNLVGLDTCLGFLMLPSIIQGANVGCDYVINLHHIVFYKQPHSSLLKYFSNKSIYGRSSTCGHILVYNYFQSGSIKNLISYLERKYFFYLYVIFRSDMSHSYRDTQGVT